MRSKFLTLIVFNLLLSSILMGQSSSEIENEIRIMIFINGNRGPKFNNVKSNNELHLKDPTGYWYNYDEPISTHYSHLF